MYLFQNLKPERIIADDQVPCPVAGCMHTVRRQRGTYRRAPEFFCNEHRLCISPSTYEHLDYAENFLFSSDREFLESCFDVKREKERLGRERSEDAVTFNVFRPLERLGLIGDYLAEATGFIQDNPRLVYWSYSPPDRGTWPLLERARATFGEVPTRGSEPDLIAVGEKTLTFIEVKLTATNNTRPSAGTVRPSYESGASSWFRQVFRGSAEEIAVHARKYELMRFWLLGSWIAHETGREFALFSLNPATRREDFGKSFDRFLVPDDRRRFISTTWEDLASFIGERQVEHDDLATVHNYLAGKTIGYDPAGRLRRAFQLGELN
ncbi:MAG: PGN_0703 family putative restriction endonuclease [Thermoleophilia bacterium]